jgi:delta 1-pyrroline-5-carboxylate dehydrogenase
MKKTKLNFIAGEWLDGASAADNINPSDTSDIIGEYAHASAAQTEQAIDAARQASSAWGNSSIQNRSDMLEVKHCLKVLVRPRERVRFLSFSLAKRCAPVENLLILFDPV